MLEVERQQPPELREQRDTYIFAALKDISFFMKTDHTSLAVIGRSFSFFAGILVSLFFVHNNRENKLSVYFPKFVSTLIVFVVLKNQEIQKNYIGNE